MAYDSRGMARIYNGKQGMAIGGPGDSSRKLYPHTGSSKREHRKYDEATNL